MARGMHSRADSIPAHEPTPSKGELGTSLNRIGEPYTPHTTTEKQAWGALVKKGLDGFLTIAEKVGATPEEIDHGIEALGFRDLYAMSLGEGVR